MPCEGVCMRARPIRVQYNEYRNRTRCTELILLFRSLSSRRLHGGLSTPAGAPQSTAGSAVRATEVADQEAHRVLEGASQVRRASARPASMILL